MIIRNLLRVAASGAALWLGAGTLLGSAGPPDDAGRQSPAGGAVASVDMERVFTAAGGPDLLARKAAEIDAEAVRRLNSLASAPYLNRAELQEYGGLLEKSQPAPADQERIKALKAVSDQRDAELRMLQVKKDTALTDADRNRLRELADQRRLLENVLPKVQEDLRQQQVERVETYRREQMALLRATVGQVAREKGVSQVFDASTLIYSVTDLTGPVTQRVQKRAGK